MIHRLTGHWGFFDWLQAGWVVFVASVILYFVGGLLWSLRPGRDRRRTLVEDPTIARGVSYYRRKFLGQDLEALKASGVDLWQPDRKRVRRLQRKR